MIQKYTAKKTSLKKKVEIKESIKIGGGKFETGLLFFRDNPEMVNSLPSAAQKVVKKDINQYAYFEIEGEIGMETCVVVNINSRTILGAFQ